jgi:putative ABC transport system permease protein
MPPAVWPLVVRLLTRAVPARNLTPVLGDLVEDYGRRLVVLGRVRAELWLLREGLSLSSAYRIRGRIARVRPETWIGRLRSDLLHAWRATRARPLSTLATAAVLSLGIGLVSAMFALADPYLFRPLPFERPNELVRVLPRTFATANLPTVADWRARGDLFAGLAATGAAEVRDLRIDDRPAPLRVAAVSADFFEVLGVPVPLPADWREADASGAAPVVLTAAASDRLFGRQHPAGRLLRSNEARRPSLRVAAELPASFVDPFVGDRPAVDGYVPLDPAHPLVTVEVSNGGTGFRASSLFALARLRPGVGAADVEAALATARLNRPREPLGPPPPPLPTDGVAILVRPLAARATEAAEAMARGVLAAGFLVLLVCVANVANLLLARGAARTREFAAREALGATRLAIARLVLTELGIVTFAGVSLGLVVAKGALVTSALVIPSEYVTLGAPDLSWRVAAFAAAAGLLVMMGGLVPAWAAWRVTPSALVAQTAAGETRAIRALRFSMTATQTAVAVVLLTGAALLGRSFANLATHDPGYDGDTFALDVRVPSSAPASRPATVQDVEATISRLQRLAGVGAAGATTGGLVSSTTSMSLSRITLGGRRVNGSVRGVTTGFFGAAGTRLVAGRLPRPDDRGRAAVVSASFAASCCGSESPLGLVVDVSRRGFEIVGVVKDIQTRALDEPPGPVVFLPLDGSTVSFVTYLLRSDRPDAALALAAGREVLAVHGSAVVTDAGTMRDRLMRSVNDRSFATLVAAFFAAAAIGVSAAGLFGVVAFLVARRTREIAIRIAMGATGFDVARQITSEARLAAGTGTALGLLAASSVSETLESLLFGVAAADVSTFAAAAALVVCVVGVAAWLPAGRAARLSPTVALRVE